MDLNLRHINSILQVLGVKDLAIRFDIPNEQIIATFTRSHQKQVMPIKFTEIESCFTESNLRPPGAQQVDDRYIDIDTIPD